MGQLARARDLALERTVPALGVIRCMSRRAAVDLPQPDSPTMPSVSPARARIDAIHGPHHGAGAAEQSCLEREVLHQALHVQEWRAFALARHAHDLMSMAERSPSVSRLKEIEVRKIITPGRAHSSGCV